MFSTLVHLAIDPILSLAYFTIRALMLSIPVLVAALIVTFFADIFYYFLTNAGF